MDVIDDVDMALEAYLAAEFPSDIGEMYLWTYGVYKRFCPARRHCAT